jgi:hypothetical protein
VDLERGFEGVRGQSVIVCRFSVKNRGPIACAHLSNCAPHMDPSGNSFGINDEW